MSSYLKKRFKILCVILCAAFTFLSSAGAKPTLTFTMPPSIASFQTSLTSFRQKYVAQKQINHMKSYSGTRLQNDTLLMIYYHDQAVAIVELGPAKLLISCEIIEIYSDNAGKKLLQQLSKINRPLEIGFNDMLKLMNQCEQVELLYKSIDKRSEPSENNENNISRGMVFPTNPFSLLSGIIPGTKWCGTGDIAETYRDLGTENTMDRCCRAHDLCPIKIRAYQQRYNLINNSLYTKSHCVCDDLLYSCLKTTNTSAAQLMGSIYFNLVQVPCLRDTKNGYVFRNAREGF